MKIKKRLAALAAVTVIGTMSITSVSADDNNTSGEWMTNIGITAIGNEVVNTDGDILVYSDGEGILTSNKRNFSMNYVVTEGTNADAEYFGLSSQYTVTKSTDEENTYTIITDSEETSNQLLENAKALLNENKITNAYTQMTFDYKHAFKYLKLTLEEEDSDFDPNKLGIMEAVDYSQSESDPKVYTMAKSNPLAYDYDELAEKFKAVDNIADATVEESYCEFNHSSVVMRTYLVYENTWVNSEDDSYNFIGDANNDGKVDASDAAFIANKLANNQKNELSTLADFNGDGKISALDSASIAKYLAEKSLTK